MRRLGWTSPEICARLASTSASTVANSEHPAELHEGQFYLIQSHEFVIRLELSSVGEAHSLAFVHRCSPKCMAVFRQRASPLDPDHRWTDDAEDPDVGPVGRVNASSSNSSNPNKNGLKLHHEVSSR